MSCFLKLSMRYAFGIFTLAFFLCACGSSLQGQGDGGSPSACSTLSPCACLASTRCVPVTEACWCPYPACDPNGACGCGGGRFLGCQEGSNCPTIACGLGTKGELGPDGCPTCAPEPDCGKALANVSKSCAGNPYLPGLAAVACKSDPTCEASCLSGLLSCDGITCAFCQTCDCEAPISNFSTCLAACGAAAR